MHLAMQVVCGGILSMAMLGQAAGQQTYDDPTRACHIAAGRAESEWLLPRGLLAAIGFVESGRASAGTPGVIWPWTVNSEGRGFYLPTKAAAIALVHALQVRGVRVIDVGCFQIDLFYHPYAFASLEEAFDPVVNARVAARILSHGRFASTGWDGAIAVYHSASPLLGWAYLQKVRAVWPWASAHTPWGQDATTPYAVLLSPQASLVRVVTPASAAARPSVAVAPVAGPPGQVAGPVQWLRAPTADLPRVLTPSGAN